MIQLIVCDQAVRMLVMRQIVQSEPGGCLDPTHDLTSEPTIVIKKECMALMSISISLSAQIPVNFDREL